MDEVEKRILDAALKIFSIDGYSGSTTKKIAEEANVAEVTLFRKFKSKDNLLLEVLIHNKTTLATMNMISKIDINSDIEKQLKTIINNILKKSKDDAEFNKFLMTLSILIQESTRNPEIKSILVTFIMEKINFFKEFFDYQINAHNIRELDTRMLAFIFISFIMTRVLFKSFFSEQIQENLLGQPNEQIEPFVDILINGITTKIDIKSDLK